MNIAIVGATGMVGQKFLELLQESPFAITKVRLFASPKNQGKAILFRPKGKTPEGYKSQNLYVESLSDKINLKSIDIAFFSAGEKVSREWAPLFAKAGAFVIDNSSAFRAEKHIPLIVPEVNGEHLNPMFIPKGHDFSATGKSKHLSPLNSKSGKIKCHRFKSCSSQEGQKGGIIANPNCSTIQLVMALSPLSQHFGLSEVHISTYQAVSGAGRLALEKLKQESQELLSKEAPSSVFLPASKKSVAFNCIPQIGHINPAGFSTEEWKLMQETKKILNLPHLKVTATAVRVPAFNGHGEAILLTLKQATDKTDFISVLSAQKGLKVLEGDDLPHQRFVDGKDDIYVSRIRPVPSKIDGPERIQGLKKSKEWMMWIAGDNLRKGAALNGLQIAKTLLIADNRIQK